MNPYSTNTYSGKSNTGSGATKPSGSKENADSKQVTYVDDYDNLYVGDQSGKVTSVIKGVKSAKDFLPGENNFLVDKDTVVQSEEPAGVPLHQVEMNDLTLTPEQQKQLMGGLLDDNEEEDIQSEDGEPVMAVESYSKKLLRISEEWEHKHTAGKRHNMMDHMLQHMSAESLLSELVHAMSDQEALENFDFIAGNHDIPTPWDEEEEERDRDKDYEDNILEPGEDHPYPQDY